MAVVAGSPGAGVARQAGASVVALTFLPEQALAAVAAGQVQAAVVDEPLARGYAADHRGLTVAGGRGGDRAVGRGRVRERAGPRRVRHGRAAGTRTERRPRRACANAGIYKNVGGSRQERRPRRMKH